MGVVAIRLVRMAFAAPVRAAGSFFSQAARDLGSALGCDGRVFCREKAGARDILLRLATRWR